MGRKKWTRAEKILWLTPGLFLLSVWGILYAPRLSRSLEAAAENWGVKTPGLKRRRVCISNLKQMGMAVAMYRHDYDDRHPLVSTVAPYFGWGELVSPYMMAPAYNCPTNPIVTSARNPTSSKYTNYYYNVRLSNASIEQLSNPSQTILFGEGTSSDARYAKTHFPSQWVNSPNSPARIHFEPGMATGGNANYAFADGHVNRMQPQFISSGSPLGGEWTFALR